MFQVFLDVADFFISLIRQQFYLLTRSKFVLNPETKSIRFGQHVNIAGLCPHQTQMEWFCNQ